MDEQPEQPTATPQPEPPPALPAPVVTARVRLPGIAPRAFQHPADRAALAALRKVPAIDLVLRKLVGFVGERGLRLVFLASAVRVNERQFARLHGLYRECCEILDVAERPELFVAQTPFVNAGAVGVDRPFIVLNSAALQLMSDDELRFLLGHELGHVACDHTLYKTMLSLLLHVSVARLGLPLGGLALLGVIAALSEWDRKSELSCDRAGLLCLQAPWRAYAAFMKLAGGSAVEQMDIREFVAQAEEYESAGDEVDSVFKLLNLVGRRHPFHVLRLVEVKRWVERGDYDRILRGEYERRGEGAPEPSLYEDLAASARSYGERVAESQDPLVQLVRDLGAQVSEVGGNLWETLRRGVDRARGRGPDGEGGGPDGPPPGSGGPG
jgi:Zn-dependent protease with chaperone function